MSVTQSTSFQFAAADIEKIEKKKIESRSVYIKFENIEIDEQSLIKCLSRQLTFLEVVCFSDIDEYEGHELELGEALPGGGGDGQEVAQLVDLVVDVVPPHLARPLRRLVARVIAGTTHTLYSCQHIDC